MCCCRRRRRYTSLLLLPGPTLTMRAALVPWCPGALLPWESTSLASPFTQQSLFFAAARRPSSRGFPGRGCDGTCHGTVEPRPVQVPPPKSQESQAGAAWVGTLVQRYPGTRMARIPTQHTSPSPVRDESREVPRGGTRYMSSARLPRQSFEVLPSCHPAILPSSASLSSCSSQKLCSCSHPAVAWTAHWRRQDKCRGRSRKRDSPALVPCHRGHCHRPASWAAGFQRRPPLNRHHASLFTSPLSPITPPGACGFSFSFSFNSEGPRT